VGLTVARAEAPPEKKASKKICGGYCLWRSYGCDSLFHLFLPEKKFMFARRKIFYRGTDSKCEVIFLDLTYKSSYFQTIRRDLFSFKICPSSRTLVLVQNYFDLWKKGSMLCLFYS